MKIELEEKYVTTFYRFAVDYHDVVYTAHIWAKEKDDRLTDWDVYTRHTGEPASFKAEAEIIEEIQKLFVKTAS